MRDRTSRAAKVLVLLLVALAAGAFAQGPGGRLEKYACRFDFEAGSVGAWSSYPPAQDTAYDPTIWVKQLPGNPGLALVREVRPNYPIDYIFGVRKKLDILIDGDSRLVFRFLIKNYGHTDAVLVKLALADGTSKEIRLPAGQNEVWQSADVPLGQYAPPGPPVKLEALALMAVCIKADPEAKLWLAVDDVEVTGWRAKPAAINAPRVHWLEEFSAFVAARHFVPGEDVELRGELPFAAPHAYARAASLLPEGKPFIIPLERTGPAFKGKLPGGRLRPGLWRVEIVSKADGDEMFPSVLYFLVGANGVPPSHPYLLLSAAQKSRLRDVIGRPGRGRDIWEKLRQEAQDFRSKYRPTDFAYNLDAYDEVFWLPTYGGYSNTIRTLSGFARSNGFIYALSGDLEAGRAAREALLKMAEWPTFVHPHILKQGQFTYWPVGLVLIDLAAAYDFAYGLLSPAERQTVARALYHKGITEVFKEYVRDNRVSSDTSNWISHVTGGGILSAVAVAGEIKDEELEPYLTGMILKLDALVRATFDRDGDYGEGYGYHNFTMQTLSEIMPVLAARFGIEFPEKVRRSHLYLPYQLNPATGAIHDFGDTGTRLIPLSNFAYILGATRDPLLAWLDRLAPGADEADLIYWDDSVQPAPPGTGLSPVKLFRDVGTAVFRSGFGPEDFSFVFRAGPFYNHQHFDQGSFFVADRGEDFLVEGGRTDYYSDPWYQSFFIQPGAHNCILVDGNVESQRAGDILTDVPAWQDFARITDFLDFAEGAFLSAELAPIYKDKFETLRRVALFLKPRTIVLIDSGEGGRETTRLDLRFHAPLKENIQLEPGAARIRRGGHELLLRTLSPRDAAAEVRKRPLSLDEFRSENPLTMKARGYLQLSAAVRDGRVQLVNILGTDREQVGGAALTDKGNYLDLAVSGQRFLIRRVPGEVFEADGKSINADLFSATGDAFRALRVSEIREGPRLVFRSDAPVSLSFEPQAKPVRLTVWAAGASTIEIACPVRPGLVEEGGRPLKDWSWEKGLLRLKVPKEGSTITISGRPS